MKKSVFQVIIGVIFISALSSVIQATDKDEGDEIVATTTEIGVFKPCPNFPFCKDK